MPKLTPPREGASAQATLFRHRFANADFDESTGVLKLDGQAVAIEPTPLRLLAELLHHVNEAVTKEELLDAVWEGRVTVDNVLPNAVNKLRKALGEAAAAHIVSLPRVGYRLLGSVERTVVGQPDVLPLALRGGEPVPGREGFVLLRPLGSGGRGNVWLAQHVALGPGATPGDQRVFKFAADADGLRALKREFTLFRVLKAELSDLANGTGFAQVIDANFAESPYHLECAYGGLDLLAWAAEGGHLLGMGVAQRLALFLPIAQAVAAAHSVGVLHKDLKPANVLIGGQAGAWQPVLTDFGSGHAIDPERLRQLGLTAMGLTLTHGVSADTTLGTAMYMAPEVQAGQASTVQSDLYALGLMLYQLLAGDLRRPMSTGWQRDIGDELLCEDIAAATEGQPQARLGSVSALVERLANVEDRRAQRLRALAAEQRALAVAAEADQRRARRPWLVGLAASLLIGIVASTWFFISADRERLMAQQASRRAEAVTNFLHREVLEAPDAVTANLQRPLQMIDVLRRASRNATSHFEGQPLAEAELRRKLLETHLRTASLAEARVELNKANALFAKSAEPGNVEWLTLRLLGVRLDVWQSRFEPALTALQDVERLAGAALLAPSGELAYAGARARFDYLMSGKHHREALPLAKRLLSLADSLGTADSTIRLDARQRLMEVHYLLGEMGEFQALVAEVSGPPFNAKGRETEIVARQAAVQAEEAHLAGDFVTPEKPLQDAKALLLKAEAPNLFHLAFIELHLGATYNGRGELPRALECHQRSIDLFVTSMGAQHGYTKIAELNVANTLLLLGRASEALPLFEGVERWFVAVSNRGSHPVALFGMAGALIDLGRAAEAQKVLATVSVKELERVHTDKAWSARLQAEKGRAAMLLGDRAQGLRLIQSGIEGMVAVATPDWALARYRRWLAPAQPAARGQ